MQATVGLAENPRPVAGAVPETERIETLDTLRGFAVLGILVMNIQSFSMIDAAYVYPPVFGDFHGVNYAVWLVSHVFADQKFMTLFSMLFGAGLVLQTSRQEKARGRSAAIHYRRMGVLLLIGLLHAYLFWQGDILTCYGLCGMVVYWFRRFPIWLLLLLGLLSLSVPPLLSEYFYRRMASWTPAELADFTRGFQPSADAIAEEVAANRGSWWEAVRQRAPVALEIQTFYFGIALGWRASGNMLVGMALFKLGVLSGRRSVRFYVALIALAVLVGLPLVLYGVHRIAAENWDVAYLVLAGSHYNYWGSILVALGYIGLIMLACRRSGLHSVAQRLAAVGRLALTNYLMQTLICTTIFYGYGLGLFGKLERIEQLGIVLAVWIVQLILSPLWLRYFLFGPAEWLWRALTFLYLPPFRRTLQAT